MSLLDYYDAYTRHGLKIIPLLPRSKRPFLDRWNSGEQNYRSYFRDPTLNMGVALGSVVDVEGDTPEANKILADLIGNIPHPRYRSQKSVHHLFQNPDPDLTRFVVSGVEFRANLHQSALPPSIHETGAEYCWLIGSEFPVAAMPDRLLDYYLGERKKRAKKSPVQDRLKPGHMATHCANCGEEAFLHVKRHALEVVAFQKYGERWTCHQCRKRDLREECRFIRKTHC